MLAIGCMRLSTDPDRDDERSVTVLHAALDAGVTFLDTADAYCWTNDDIGHNERLLARAIGSWSGDRSHHRQAALNGVVGPNPRPVRQAAKRGADVQVFSY
jgi:predicted aldo/keto reductase-like oxidoreductase